MSSPEEKKKKKKKVDKYTPFLSMKYDELVNFDVFDFIQSKTQIKLINKRSHQDLDDLQVLLKTSKPKKIKTKSKSKKQKVERKPKMIKTVINEEAIAEFQKKYPEIKSLKKIRAMIKTNDYIKEFLKKHPEIPVEKSHRRMGSHQLAKEESSEKMLREKLPTADTAKRVEVNRTDVNLSESMKRQPAKNVAPIRNGLPQNQPQQVDHVAAINNWIQKNYHTLSAQQKQLVHMQLQYLHSLKNTFFANSPFILSTQHLNNLNNMAFLHQHYNPVNRNYTNFLNLQQPESPQQNQTNPLLMQNNNSFVRNFNLQNSNPGSPNQRKHLNQNGNQNSLNPNNQNSRQ